MRVRPPLPWPPTSPRSTSAACAGRPTTSSSARPPRRGERQSARSEAGVLAPRAAPALHAFEHPRQIQIEVGLVAELLVAAHDVGQEPLRLAPGGVDAQLD